MTSWESAASALCCAPIPVFLGLQKTRLLDPLLSFPGTNDQPGDYRGSGCTACHVIYANDRSPEHSGPYAPFGHLGRERFVRSDDREERVRAIRFGTRSRARFPPANAWSATFTPARTWRRLISATPGGTTKRTASRCIPQQQRHPTADERHEVAQRNPEGAAPRGLWSDPKFLEQLGSAEFNAQLKQSQFADFHSHGWVFRAVYKRDRKGNLLDGDNKTVSADDPKKFDKAVHLKDIHLEKGMQCVDCHFQQDVHGNGKLYAEPRAAIELDCTDCHGTIEKRATLITSGPAAPNGGTHLDALRTPWNSRRFEWRDGKLYQRSMVEPDQGMGSGADAGHDHARQSSLQREIAMGENRAARRHDLGRASGGRIAAGAREQPHDLLRLPHVVDAELFRLPSFDDREPAHAHAAQRRPDHAQLHVLQLPGAARRRLHAGNRRHGDGASRGASALFLRDHWSARKIRIANGSTTGSRRFRPRDSRARRSAHSCRTRCGRRKPRPATIVTSPSATTTTRGWRRSCCRAPTF